MCHYPDTGCVLRRKCEMLSHPEIVDLISVSRLRFSNAMLQYEERSLGGGSRIQSIDYDALNAISSHGLAYARKTLAIVSEGA